jgi:hypothetical protein
MTATATAIAPTNELDEMRTAAERVLTNGWYLFGCAYASKMPFKNSHGHQDALSGENRTEALRFWTNPQDSLTPRNPAIACKPSHLVVIDCDHGFEGLSDEQVLTKAESIGLPRTYTVRSGAARGGAHFYYSGARALPDMTGKNGWRVADCSGDIKHNGFVLAAGAIHDKTRKRYRIINDAPVQPLPTFWRELARPEREKITKENVLTLSLFEDLRRDGANYTSEEWDILREVYPEMAKAQKRILRTRPENRETICAGQLIPVKNRQAFLTRQMVRMRKLSFPLSVIRLSLTVIAVHSCEGGAAYMKARAPYWDKQVFGWCATIPAGEIDFPKGKGLTIRAKKTQVTALAEVMQAFPESIPTSEALNLLEARVAPFDRKSANDQKAVSRARTLAGFEVAGRLWKRKALNKE